MDLQKKGYQRLVDRLVRKRQTQSKSFVYQGFGRTLSPDQIYSVELRCVSHNILGEAYPDVIRRNASIALANIGKRRVEALEALKTSLASAKGELRQYYLWAISTLQDTEIAGIDPSTCQER